MNKLRQLMFEHSVTFCVSGARKVHFSPLVGTVINFSSVSFTNRFLTMQWVVEMETEQTFY